MLRVFIVIPFICMFLCACGPKAVGQNEPQAEITGVGYAVDDPGQLRYPLSGRSVDTYLYYLNQPQSMNMRQSYYNSLLPKREGEQQAPNDYNNLQPRQVSPFR